MASTRSLKSKLALNLSSTVLPMFVGLASVPVLIDGIGVERFGLLSIAWMLVGYFSLLDMGLGRALTQKVANRIGIGNTNNLKALILSALSFITLLGFIGSLILYLTAETLIYETFKISPEYRDESLRGLYWLALTIPFTILATGLFGVLEGQQHFGWTSIVRAPMGALMFVAPVLAMKWKPSLDVIFASIFIIRAVGFIALALIILKTTEEYIGWRIDLDEVKSLFNYGGWITISNISSPIMTYFDRFYIAAILSASVVAYYTTPVDFLSKILLIPLALITVMFSSFATDWQKKPHQALHNYKRSIAVVAAIMTPLAVTAYMTAHDGLSIWIGKDFADNSHMIVKVIAIGIFFNAMAMVPYAFIQATGRADITAKFHLFELPLFLLMLWLFTDAYGLTGAALAWTIRMALDSTLLYSYAHKMIKETLKNAPTHLSL